MLAAPISKGATLLCRVVIFENVALTSFDQIATAQYFVPQKTGAETGCQQGQQGSVAVLEVAGAITAGRQFDRYGALWVDEVEVLRTTTPEPNAERAIAWSVERDVTDYATFLLEANRTARLSIPNVVDDTYTGVPTLSVNLSVYSVDDAPFPPADAATSLVNKGFEGDVIIHGSSSKKNFANSANPWAAVSATGPSAVVTGPNVSFPFPVARALVDVYATGHACDEFYYTNAPGNATECGGGAFREIVVSVDGVVAGAALPFPVVYSGGLDPLLWRPLAGVASFDAPPYRFDVTPFAARFSSGRGARLEVEVVDANSQSGVWYVDPVVLAWRAPSPFVAVTETDFVSSSSTDSSEDDDDDDDNGVVVTVDANETLGGETYSTSGRSQFSVQATLRYDAASSLPRGKTEEGESSSDASLEKVVRVESRADARNELRLSLDGFAQRVDAVATTQTLIAVNTTSLANTSETASLQQQQQQQTVVSITDSYPLRLSLVGEACNISLARNRRFDVLSSSSSSSSSSPPRNVSWASAVAGVADLVASGASDVGTATTRAETWIDSYDDDDAAPCYDWRAVATNGSVVRDAGRSDFACGPDLARLGLRSCGLDLCGLNAFPYYGDDSSKTNVVGSSATGKQPPSPIIVRASAHELRRWSGNDDASNPMMTSLARRPFSPRHLR